MRGRSALLGVFMVLGAFTSYTAAGCGGSDSDPSAGAGNSGSGASSGTGGAGGQGGGSVVPGDSVYGKHFLDLYAKIKDPQNGYFSPEGIPYHAVETLIVEAPDYGHETTSEAMSYYVWLEAMYGSATGDWEPFKKAWQITETYLIPSSQDQSTQGYDPAKPATYAAEHDTPNGYPSQLVNTPGIVGQDPLGNELKTTYGTSDIYAMHWILDVDNWYGYGHCGDGTTRAAFINTFQRGPQESVWETVPQPSCETFAFGGQNGYLDLFTGDASYSTQVRYTAAPDADARLVQATYMAKQFATAQGKASEISAEIDKARKLGDYLRYAMYDKYFKKIGDCVGVQNCPAASGKDSAHYLLSWYFAWGGSYPMKQWSWRISSSHAHGGYQNPFAAWVLAEDMVPDSPTAGEDWGKSLQRQIEFYTWLQSAEGGIAGGATNSWQGSYAEPPAGTPTFYGMFYDEKPVYHDPPSNNWFGFQAWTMERIAYYYHETNDEKVRGMLDRWVAWAMANTTAGNGELQIPSNLQWSGKPDTWNPASPGANASLHVEVVSHGQDLGVAGSLARILTYYAAATGNAEAKEMAKNILDTLVTGFADDQGYSTVEQHAEHTRFNEEVYIPPGWTGTMPNGDVINSDATFLSIRSQYMQDPEWSKVQAYLDGGPAPEFRYHRFWAEVDIALSFAEYARLLE